MNETPLPVLIAGGGPVGLALAVELGIQGIACVLVEKRDGSVTVPKMSGLTTRGMELNRRWGIAEKVRQHGWPPRYVEDFVYCTSLTGYELARHHVPSDEERGELPYTPEGPRSCAQIFYDPILLEKARSMPAVTLRHMVQIDSFTQDEDAVHAVLTDNTTGQQERLSARFLVGCDGASGTVPRALGVSYDGLGTFSNSVNVFFRSPQLGLMHDKGWARFYRFTDAGGSWGELIGIDGKELWRLSVFRADTRGDPKALDGDAWLRRLAGRDFDYEILSVMAWDRREGVAKRYRHGRVFLCGDSAHQNSPTGGLGLHTGLGDAADLGWKLAAVLRGWGGEALLDSYEAERQPVALANVRACTVEFDLVAELPGGPEIADASPEGEALRRRFRDAFEESDHVQFPKLTENLRTGYCYDSSPVIIPDGSPEIPVETPEFVPSARPGTRAPHGWLAPRRSTLDLFRDHFVLLRFGANLPAADAIVDAAARRGVPLQVVDVTDERIAALYVRRLVLVRPDGHVSWRADAPPEDPNALIDVVRGARSRFTRSAAAAPQPAA